MNVSIRDLAESLATTLWAGVGRFRGSRHVDRELVSNSSLFDVDCYLAEHPDVAAAGMDPVVHYLEYGFREGRYLGPDFDTAYYINQIPERDLADTPPLVHYLKVGRRAGLKPRPGWGKPPAWARRILADGHAWSLDEVETLINRLRRGEAAGVQQLSEEKADRRRILFVIATRSGGTPLTNRDLMSSLSASHDSFVLQCTRNTVILEHFADGVYTKLDHHVLRAPIEPVAHRSGEYDHVVFRWLLEWRIGLVHVRHIAWHGLGLVDMAKLLNLPVVFSFHDYYTVCPTVKLLDNRSVFCGGVCTTGAGDCTPEDLWPEGYFGQLKHEGVRVWQSQFRGFLSNCDACVSTTEKVRRIVSDCYPELGTKPFTIIPHGRDFPKMSQLANEPSKGEALRLAVPGNLNLAKGGALVAALATMADSEVLEIHVLGSMSPDLRLPESVICHGPYHRDELIDLLAKIRPHAGAVLSIWPETWCHTLTELWAAGIPVVGFDTGAVGQRLRASGAGWLASAMTPGAVFAVLEQVRRPGEWTRARQAVVEWQQGEGRHRSCATMGEAYLALYATLWESGVAGTSSPAGNPAQTETSNPCI